MTDTSFTGEPFFQEQLTADRDARYPIGLFVGRTTGVERLGSGVRRKRGSSSRKTVRETAWSPSPANDFPLRASGWVRQ